MDGTFEWHLADAAPTAKPGDVQTETITDFNPAAASAGGDVLDLRDVLGDISALQEPDTLQHYIEFDTTTEQGSTIVRISANGGFAAQEAGEHTETQRIILDGVDLRLGLKLGEAATDADVIAKLLSTHKLLIDHS